MKRKVVSSIIPIMIICILVISTNIKNIQPKLDEFARGKDEIRYNLASNYLDVTCEVPGMTAAQIAKMLGEKNIESNIEAMYLLINEYIELLDEEGIKNSAVYADPYNEIYNIIALEHAYYLAKSGVNEESEEWDLFMCLILPINMNISNYRARLDILAAELEKPTFRYSTARDIILTDYVGAYESWNDLESEAILYLNDTNIPDEKKQWVENYISTRPFDKTVEKLKEKGIDWKKYDPLA